VTPQHRKTHRRPSFIIAEYSVKEGVFRDIIKNIGPSGIFIGTQRGIASNQDIVLKFPLFSFKQMIKVRGQVVRSGPHGFAVTLETPIMGLIGEDGQFHEIVHEIDRH